MANNFGWLPDPAAEVALHAERLLFIEERPFQRVTKRLLGADSTLRNVPKQQPTPPPEGEDKQDIDKKAPEPFSREKFWEDVLVDFAALQSSITRIQLIHSSNERERERYASEKDKILATAQAVRENTVVLRAQLTEAQNILQLRKGYDELAGKILDDKKLRSREDAKQAIATLENEIAGLQAEGGHIEEQWVMRKEGFEKVVQEGRSFLRDIKGVKDQPDDGLTEDDVDMQDGEDDVQAGTPRPNGSSTPQGQASSAGDHEENDNTNQDEERVQSKLRETELAPDMPISDAPDTSQDVDVTRNEQSQEDAVQPDVIEQDTAEDDNVVETMDET